MPGTMLVTHRPRPCPYCGADEEMRNDMGKLYACATSVIDGKVRRSHLCANRALKVAVRDFALAMEPIVRQAADRMSAACAALGRAAHGKLRT